MFLFKHYKKVVITKLKILKLQISCLNDFLLFLEYKKRICFIYVCLYNNKYFNCNFNASDFVCKNTTKGKNNKFDILVPHGIFIKRCVFRNFAGCLKKEQRG